MTYFIFMIVLALFGVGETVYLISKRRKNQKPVCLGKDDCNLGLNSKYNKIFGVHNDVLGLVFYAFVFISHLIFLADFLAIDFVHQADDFVRILLLAFIFVLFVSFIMSLRFVFLMAFKVKAWCQWCVGSAVTVGLMVLIVLFYLGTA